jgi:hypothetical protein
MEKSNYGVPGIIVTSIVDKADLVVTEENSFLAQFTWTFYYK